MLKLVVLFFDDANDYQYVVSTVVYDGICGAPIIFDYLCVISLGRFVLMRMVLHCTAAAKHMRFGAGEH